MVPRGRDRALAVQPVGQPDRPRPARRAPGDAYGYFRVLPRSIQVWRGIPELAGRWVMRDGAWAD
ncbi:hypothetical protein GCM10023205_21420 [Yinghuangia aomiensis]|uniref:Uncharacterized protein n=1 Tax=Yinghuangia aomiensis TaxID=676205 RepID=A0ABP9H5U9_9ACTN